MDFGDSAMVRGIEAKQRVIKDKYTGSGGILHKLKLKLNLVIDVALPIISIAILAFVFYGSFVSIDRIVIIASVKRLLTNSTVMTIAPAIPR